MRMSWLGLELSNSGYRLAPHFSPHCHCVVVYYGSVTVIPHDGPCWRSIPYNILTTAFVLYAVVVLMRLRAAVRAKYEIPT